MIKVGVRKGYLFCNADIKVVLTNLNGFNLNSDININILLFIEQSSFVRIVYKTGS